MINIVSIQVTLDGNKYLVQRATAEEVKPLKSFRTKESALKEANNFLHHLVKQTEMMNR